MKHKVGHWLLFCAVVVAGIWYSYPHSGEPVAESRVEEAPPVVEKREPPAQAPEKQHSAAVVATSEPAADTAGQEEAAMEKALPPVLVENPDALLPDTREAVNALFSTSHEGLETEPVAGGGEMIHLKKYFRSVPVAIRQADGSITVRDYVSPPAGEPSEEGKESPMDTEEGL